MSAYHRTPSVLLLTGSKRSGKTTACLRFVELARNRGLRVGGIVAPGRWDADGRKNGIDVLDLFSGARRQLATIASPNDQTTVGEYLFDERVMDWALGRVMWALATPLDAVLIDEIGRLELDKRRGFAPALGRIAVSPSCLVVLVVRLDLVTRLRASLIPLQSAVLQLVPETRDCAPGKILAHLARASGVQVGH